MKKVQNILIADNSRNIRDFLKREMMIAGHSIKLAKNAEEVIFLVHHQKIPFDFIILDPFYPYIDEYVLLERILDPNCSCTIIIHTLYPEQLAEFEKTDKVVLIEKRENSLENILKLILNQTVPVKR